jgi:hypothetical protein
MAVSVKDIEIEVKGICDVTWYDVSVLDSSCCTWHQTILPKPDAKTYTVHVINTHPSFECVVFHVHRQVTEIVSSSLHLGRGPVQEHQGLSYNIVFAEMKYRNC